MTPDMTLRDLTKRQLYNLRRRCEKEMRAVINPRIMLLNEQQIWRVAYNAGLKAGLELHK